MDYTCAGELRAPRRAPNIQFSYFVVKMAFWNKYTPSIWPKAKDGKNDEKWRKTAEKPKNFNLMNLYDKDNRKLCLEKFSNFFGIF